MIFKRLKKKYDSLIGHKINLFLTKNVWVSLGENCLSDNILSRYNLKSFSSPYSHGRSNIDYALKLEKTNYANLLDSRHLSYQKLKEATVVRSTLINDCDNIFNPLHMKGFEFTHHNIIDSKEAKESALRKINRLLTLKGKKNFFFLYHYRVSENRNIESLLEKINSFSTFYSKKGKECTIIIFTQKIIKNHTNRKVRYHSDEKGIHFFEFHTLDAWEGDDDQLLWAKIDDDLIKKMIDECMRIERGETKKGNGYL